MKSLGALIRLAMHGRPPGLPEAAMAGAPTPQALLEAALDVARECGWVEPSAAVSIVKACADMGELLGIPADVRTWRRIRAELATLRQALHIEGDQTATDAARALEDVAAQVCDRYSVREPDAGDGYVKCEVCGDFTEWDRESEDEVVAIARVEHEGDCALALAWRALGKPGPVGHP